MTLLLIEPTETQLDEQLDSRERRRGLRVRQTRPVKVFEPTGARFADVALMFAVILSGHDNYSRKCDDLWKRDDQFLVFS